MLMGPAAAFAQSDFRPGYIRKQDGSRTNGLVDYRSEARNALGVSFKENESSKAVSYKPGEVQGYGYEGSKRYESIGFTGADSTVQTYFMEVLATGAASLYFVQEEQGKERYFLRKGDAPVQELVEEVRRVEKGGKTYKATLKPYVGLLAVAMLECPQVKQQIDKAALEQSDLVKVVDQYNACVAPEQAGTFAKKTERNFTVEKGLLAGMTLMSPNFSSDKGTHTYLSKADFALSKTVTGGVFFNLSTRKLNEKLSLITGLMYHHYSLEGSYLDKQSENIYSDYDGYLKAAYIRVPLLLRYTYPKGKIRPFVNAGVHYSFLVKSDSEMVRNYSFYGTHSTRTSPALEEFRSSEQGLLGGLGVRMPLAGKSYLILEARYENSEGPSPYLSFNSNYNALSLLVGITL